MGTVDVIICLAENAFPQCELGIKAAGDQGEILSKEVGITSSRLHFRENAQGYKCMCQVILENCWDKMVLSSSCSSFFSFSCPHMMAHIRWNNPHEHAWCSV